MTVAAVVVSYNRREFLKKCLLSLIGQTHPLDEILVVDNGSTDGSIEMVLRQFPSVSLVRSPRNIGGAGGFSLGIDLLISRGHDFAWLMDDDAEPHNDALAPLLIAMDAAAPVKPGFVAPTVVGSDGHLLHGYTPPRIDEIENGRVRTPPGTYPAAYATFVGLLVNLETAKSTFLPIADFFIWWDDYEYTSRLQVISAGLASTNSFVVHPERSESYDSGSRLRFDIRNRIWIIRCRGLASRYARGHAMYRFWRMIGTQAKYTKQKGHFVLYVLLGLAEGLLTRPHLVLPSRSEPPQVL